MLKNFIKKLRNKISPSKYGYCGNIGKFSLVLAGYIDLQDSICSPSAIHYNTFHLELKWCRILCEVKVYDGRKNSHVWPYLKKKEKTGKTFHKNCHTSGYDFYLLTRSKRQNAQKKKRPSIQRRKTNSQFQ